MLIGINFTGSYNACIPLITGVPKHPYFYDSEVTGRSGDNPDNHYSMTHGHGHGRGIKTGFPLESPRHYYVIKVFLLFLFKNIFTVTFYHSCIYRKVPFLTTQFK